MKRCFTGKPCKYGHVDERYVNGCCVACDNEKSRKYKENNKEIVSRYLKAWGEKNKDKLRDNHRSWAANNKDRMRAYLSEYRNTNRAWVRAWNQKRRCALRAAEGSFTGEQILDKLSKQRDKCANCKKKLSSGKYHIDHVMPISKGGSNYISNIEILCVKCNLTKHAKLPEQWATENGRLL